MRTAMENGAVVKRILIETQSEKKMELAVQAL